jgi:hypothetical protein
VFHLDRRLREQQQRLGAAALAVQYDDLCREPAAVVERVANALRQRGFAVRRRPTPIPPSFTASIAQPDDDSRRLAAALAAVQAGPSGAREGAGSPEPLSTRRP